MGSTFEFVVYGADAAALDWAEGETLRLESCWSRFDARSDLARLNARAGVGPIQVGRTLFGALLIARQLHRSMAGLFDPTVLRPLEAWGYDRTFADIASPVEPRSFVGPAAGFQAVVLDERASTVALPDGCGVDLGGIGKGLACDLIATGLVARGATTACISFGGDIRCSGLSPEGGWRIPVGDPDNPSSILFEHVIDGEGAIVTSTTALRRWVADGVTCHHIIDPRTGRPSGSDISGAIVTGPSAAVAEALAKSLVVAGTSATSLVFKNRSTAWFRRAGGPLVRVDGATSPCTV